MFVSALCYSLWLGFELGYLACFIGIFFNSLIAKLVVRTTLAVKVCDIVPKPILYPILWVWNFFQLSYVGMAYLFLYREDYFLVHSAFGHFLHYFYPIATIIAVLLPKEKSGISKQRTPPKTRLNTDSSDYDRKLPARSRSPRKRFSDSSEEQSREKRVIGTVVRRRY